MTTDSTDGRIVEIVIAATAAEMPDQLTVQTVQLIRNHEGSPEELAASLMANEI